jgi:prepilin-type N-terminal cleavage/methylation domain-containing protein
MVDQESKKVLKGQGAERGFTMIEMLIAMSVVTFGLVSVVGLAVYVSRTNSTSNALNVLAAAAQDQVERMRTATWTRSFEDPMLSVGGSIAVATPTPSDTPSPSPTPMSVGVSDVGTELFLYELDPDNPHHATVSNTPVGDLDITWQIRQGSTDDLRYVTIKVVQSNAPPLLLNGLTITTILSRD